MKYKVLAALILLALVLILIPKGLLYHASDKTIRLPIIMYHQVKTFKLGKDVISPTEFESDLQYLVKNNYTTITMSDLIDYVYNGSALPQKPIILTFDDGYLNNYVYAFPLLKKYKMEIVLSVIGKNVDDFTKVPDDNIDYSHANWDQLNEMISSGYVEIQNHSYNMHSQTSRYGCKRMRGETLEHYKKALEEDIMNFQVEIYQKTGQIPNTFAYPYGGISDCTDSILFEFGFKATLTCKYGVNTIKTDPACLFGLKRICRSHGTDLSKLLPKNL